MDDYLPIIVIFTSKSCKICEKFRGDGRLESKEGKNPLIFNKYYWNRKFIKKLLNKNTKSENGLYRAIEININSLIFTNYSDILEYNEFYLKNNIVTRYSAKNVENKLIFTKDVDYDYNVKLTGKELISFSKKQKTLENIVKIKVPQSILSKYIYYFP